MMEKFDLKEISGKVNDALSFVKSKIEGFVSEDEAFWMSVAMFLLGVIIGMFISPKRSLSKGSNNTTNNYTTNNYDDAFAAYDEEDEAE